MSLSLLNALMSQAPQVAQLQDKHLCIDLLRCLGLITGEGGQLNEGKEEEEAVLRTELTSDRLHFDSVYPEQMKPPGGNTDWFSTCYLYGELRKCCH